MSTWPIPAPQVQTELSDAAVARATAALSAMRKGR